MRDALALQFVYVYLPAVALIGGFALLIRSQWLARKAAVGSRVVFVSVLSAAAATVAYVVWAVVAIFTSTSSTAGIGLVFLPGTAFAVAAGVYLVVWSLLALAAHVPATRGRLAAARPGWPRSLAAVAIIAAATGLTADYAWRQARLDAAASPATSSGELTAMAAEAMAELDLEVLQRIAANEAAGTALLAEIHAHCGPQTVSGHAPVCYSVYMAMAGNAATGSDILSSLASERVKSIRDVVARNANTPVAVLEDLARDPEPSVRIAVTGNAKLPRAALEALAGDPVPQVRAYAEAALKRRGDT